MSAGELWILRVVKIIVTDMHEMGEAGFFFTQRSTKTFFYFAKPSIKIYVA